MNGIINLKNSRILFCIIFIIAIGCTRSVDKNLDIYFLDMMGGGSTLIVTPLGESVLIDTGSLEPRDRDADRIFRAAKLARLKQIDYLITTHFHSDHFGGVSALSKLIPIKKYLDKGSLPPEKDSPRFRALHKLYLEATQGRMDAIKAGDDIPLKNDTSGQIPPIRLHCVAAEKKVEGFDGDVDADLPGFELRKADNSDNASSIALVLTYGGFKFFAGGDITYNVEHHLAYPSNRVGTVDLFQVTHHGLDHSNNPLLLQSLNPTVAIAMNGPEKGIQPQTFKTLQNLAALKAIYQMHYNSRYGDEGNTDHAFIANRDDPKKGEFIKASVQPDTGVFSVMIGEGGLKREYAIRFER